MRRTLHEPTKSILVVAVMWQPVLPESTAVSAVLDNFGELEQRTKTFDFTHTSYYQREMGQGLNKAFMALKGLHGRDSLIAHKLLATKVEDGFIDSNGARLLNVDPMLVSLENVVVATSKSFPHRVYLGQGVFGDMSLLRKRSGFEGMPWTYPDYMEHLEFFEDLHRKLRQLLK